MIYDIEEEGGVEAFMDKLLDTSLFERRDGHKKKNGHRIEFLDLKNTPFAISYAAIIKKYVWYKKPESSSDIPWSMSFNEVLEEAPEEVAEELLFHLELFI